MNVIAGIALMILGMVMIGAPLAAGVASIIVIGTLMIVSGIAECVHAFKEKAWAVRIAWAVVGIVTLVSGLLVLAHPLFGLTTLTLLVAAYFLVKGVVTVIHSFSAQAGRGWLVVSGLISFLLGYLIWTNWPLSGYWAVGILVGVDTLFSGVVMLMLPRALTAPKA
jgi:uncharacterized membrane protein HdeD (DUF308 family)